MTHKHTAHCEHTPLAGEQKIFLVEGKHYEVPGRLLSAHATVESAQAEALSMVNVMLKELKQTPIDNAARWEAGLATVLERLNHMDVDLDRYPDVTITALGLQGVTSRVMEVG